MDPYMASDDTLDNVPKSNIMLYSASTWNYNSMDEKNQRFKSAYQFSTGKKASEFAVMGYEMGQLFLPMLPIFQKKDLKEIIKNIKDASINGPRGFRNFHHDLTLAPPIIDIEKITTRNDKLSRIVLEQVVALKHNDSVFYDINTQCVSGWKNPYLCI